MCGLECSLKINIMEENVPFFDKQSVNNMLSEIAKNRRYSPELPSAPPREADEQAFQDLMNNSPEQTQGPGPQPFQNLLNEQPPNTAQEETNVEEENAAPAPGALQEEERIQGRQEGRGVR